MTWVVGVAVDAVAAGAVAPGGWVARTRQAPVAIASAPVVGTECHTRRAYLVTTLGVPSAGLRWFANRRSRIKPTRVEGRVTASQKVNVPQMKDGCVKPAGGPLVPETEGSAPAAGAESSQEVPKRLARVGKEAVDFEANAFVEGVGFKPVRLSDYKGQWIVLCFSPGDFTFV